MHILHVLAEDASACCRRRWDKAVRRGALEALETWTCDTCGCEYLAPHTATLRYWAAFVPVMVLRHV